MLNTKSHYYENEINSDIDNRYCNNDSGRMKKRPEPIGPEMDWYGNSTNNRPPVANAGLDKTIILPVNMITLDAMPHLLILIII